MCGIIGYVGSRASRPLLLQGLKRLEYRGYDSAGIALLEEGGLEYVRAVGNLQFLKDAAESNISQSTTGLGHTRWATHGGVTEENAHPLTACDDRKLAIVLNGIVENYRELREELQKAGHQFTSETDAEVVAHLLEDAYDGDLVAAVRAVYQRLEGHFTFVVIHHDHPNHLVGVRHQTPMVVGLGEGENFLASNLAAFLAGDAPRAVPGRRRRRVDHAGGRQLRPRRHRRGRRARRARGRLGRRRSRALGLRDVHAQGDLRAARGRRRDDRRPRPARPSRARRPRHDRGGAARPAPHRDRRLRHRVPRRRRRPLRDRGVGARAGRARRRERVDLPQPGGRPRHARDRHLAVRRDARHDPGDEARAREGRAHRRDHEHDGLADHARGRLGALHAHRARGRRRRLEDVHRADRAAVPRRPEARAVPRHDAEGRAGVHPGRALRPAEQDAALPRRRPSDRGDRAAVPTTSRSSSTSAATSACPSRSRAR